MLESSICTGACACQNATRNNVYACFKICITKSDHRKFFTLTVTPYASQLPAGLSDNSSTGSQSGSESDTGSDTDSSSRGGGRDTSSAVRLAALSCLQQLAKADGRALHPFWIMLLPVYNPLQTKYHDATLMDAIVRDPVPKVTVLCGSLGSIGDMSTRVYACWLYRLVCDLFCQPFSPCLDWLN